jgi:hypothetical protein
MSVETTKFKSGDVIRSTIDTPLQLVQVFKDYGVVLEYHPNYTSPLFSKQSGILSVNYQWGPHWVLDEASEVQRILNEYKDDI